MGTFAKKIVISGYYGFHNSGDEAVLQAILLTLQAEADARKMKIEPVVLSADPDFTTKTYGVKAISRTNPGQIWKTLRTSDGLISGGGSLLQDVTGPFSVPYYLSIIRLAQWLKKPTFIYAQGLGPIRRGLFHNAVRSVFSRADYISVRDEPSKQYLQSIDLPEARRKRQSANPYEQVELVADPVMALSTPDSPNEQTDVQKTIGVSVRFWKNDKTFLELLGQSLNELLRDAQTELLFLPFHMPEDEQASLYVIDQIEQQYHQRIHLQTTTEPLQMLAAVGRCSLMIGMRLHALIYAANRRVPLLGISYDPKIDRFLERLDSQPAASTSAFSVADVAALARQLLADGESWRVKQEAAIRSLQEQALQPAKAVLSILAARDGEPNET